MRLDVISRMQKLYSAAISHSALGNFKLRKINLKTKSCRVIRQLVFFQLWIRDYGVSRFAYLRTISQLP